MKSHFMILFLGALLVACGDPTVGGETNTNNTTNTNQDGGVTSDATPSQDGDVQDDAQVNPLDGTVGDDGGTEDDGALEPICGDGNIDPGEQCDDGNTTDGDGCSSTCQDEVDTCGDGVLDSGEACDWQIAISSTVFEPNPDCQEDCTEPTCGDGVCNWYSFAQISTGNLDWVAEDGYNCPQDCAAYAPAYTPSPNLDCPHQIVPITGNPGHYIVANGVPCANGQCVVHQSSIPGWEGGLPNAGPYTGVQNCGACDNHCTSTEYCVYGQGCVSVF